MFVCNNFDPLFVRSSLSVSSLRASLVTVGPLHLPPPTSLSPPSESLHFVSWTYVCLTDFPLLLFCIT